MLYLRGSPAVVPVLIISLAWPAHQSAVEGPHVGSGGVGIAPSAGGAG